MSKKRQPNSRRNNQKVKVFFARKASDVVLPSKLRENMGFDIYAYFQEDNIVIYPAETKMIPTGIYSAIEVGYGIFLKERGSTGTKGIGQRSGVIDSGYRGEWFVPITNHNTKPIIITKETNEAVLKILAEDYIIYPYSKAICQAVVIPVPDIQVQELTVEDLQSIPSVRGNGCLGSSNK